MPTTGKSDLARLTSDDPVGHAPLPEVPRAWRRPPGLCHCRQELGPVKLAACGGSKMFEGWQMANQQGGSQGVTPAW